MIPEYSPPGPRPAYGSHQRGTWTMEHRRSISSTLRTRAALSEEEVRRREFRRRYIDEPRKRQFELYLETGEERVIA